jgi:predicted MFS family arabinose efflux permease
MIESLTPDIEKANTRHLYLDIFWMGAAFAMEWYFLQVFAIRLGATPAHLGTLTAVRALLLAVGAALAGRWQQRYTNQIVALRAPMIVYRALLYLGVAVAAFAPTNQVDILVGLVVLSAIPTGIGQGCFLGMLRSALSERNLAQVVARRTALVNVTVLISVVGLGQLLEHLPFPINYQIGFGLAFAASFMSWRNVQSVKVPDVPRFDPARATSAKIDVWKHPGFVRHMMAVVAICTGVFLAAPLIQLHLVRGLGASDGWISVFGLCEMGAGAVATFYVVRLSSRFGAVKMLTVATFSTFIQVLILGLTPTLPPFLVGSLAFGAGWLSIGVLMFNRLTEVVPKEGFPQYAAMYQVVVNFALFAGPLVSTFLIEHWISVPAMLLVVAAVRFGAASLTWALGPRRPVVAVPEAAEAVKMA